VDGLARAGDARDLLALLKTAWRGNIRKLLALNRDIMLRSLLLQLCFGALTVFGARLGPEIVAVNAVLMTLLTFTAYALDGFAYAVEAHSGQAYGARESGQLGRLAGSLPSVGAGGAGVCLVYACFGEQIVALLTSLPALRELASHYLIWQVILPVVGVWCYLLDGMFIGATRGAEMRNSMAVAAAGFGLTLLTLPGWVITVCGWPWRFSSRCGISLAFIWHRHWQNNTWFPSRHDIS
jgi:MATE family multidrug resistance protein